MKPKSRALGRADRPRSRLRALAVIGTAVVSFAGLMVAEAGPAAADSTEVEIAVGSDATQDVMNQYSVDLSGNLLDSFDAVDPVAGTGGGYIAYVKGASAISPAISCFLTRPDGSTQGVIALRESINPATTASPPLPTPPPHGCVDIAGSSVTPTFNTGGALLYIPFAEDALTGAVGPAAGGVVGGVTTVATNITTANLFTRTDLINLYTNCATVTEGGVTYNPNTATTGQTQIHLYVPQIGSGTRLSWAGLLGFNNSAPPACVHDHIVTGPDNGQAIQDNDGTAAATDPAGFMPFSIASWIGQSRGLDDRRHGVVLTEVNGAVPFTGTVPNERLNAAFPLNREVYNVVEACRVDSTAPLPFAGATCSVDEALVSMLVGPNSSLCQDAITIFMYGFAPLPNSNEPDSCGSIAPALRANPPPV